MPSRNRKACTREPPHKKRRPNREEPTEDDKPTEKQIPRTLDNTRVPEVSFLDPSDPSTAQLDAIDEFADYFNGERPPNVLVTSTWRPSTDTRTFVEEFSQLVNGSVYLRENKTQTVKQVLSIAQDGDFTDLVIISEAKSLPYLFTHIHLPNGPTCVYKLTNYVPRKKVPHHGKPTSHAPEVIMNQFSTRLGHRVSRSLHSLFPLHQDPSGRQVVTFHNQRDYIFFRFFRYVFDFEVDAKGNAIMDVNAAKTRMQELGPQFTLKLQWLQRGLFDPVDGEFEFKRDTAPDYKNRRRFFL
ncbi:hypothetical protein RCL1_006436 [Eukaryota sp. TZLM3-RCL]